MEADAPETLDDAFESLEFKFLLNLPDSELESPERLFFQLEQAHWYYEDFLADAHAHLQHFEKFDDFALEMFKRCEVLQHMASRFNEMYGKFKLYRATIPIFGAILLNESLTKVLLVQGYRSKSWGFPKGKVNQDESEVGCAAREVYEEIGFDCSELINPKHFVESTSKQGKRIKLFLVRGVPEDFHFEPRVRKEIGDIKFFDVAELPTTNEQSSKKFWALQTFMPRIVKWIQKNRGRVSRGKEAASRSQSRPKSQARDRAGDGQQQRGATESVAFDSSSSFANANAGSAGFKLNVEAVMQAMRPFL